MTNKSSEAVRSSHRRVGGTSVSSSNRHVIHPILLVLMLVALVSHAVAASDRFVIFGDLQDVSPKGRERDSLLIRRINAVAPAFSVFIGDIKGGNGDCSDNLYERMRVIFDAHNAPLVYTPGDNEWTDCWRSQAGGYDANERKASVIARFTAAGQSLGREVMPLQQQEDQRENARWRWRGIVFATLHMTGSNNNLQQREDAIVEHVDREAKNSKWLKETFADASDARAIVLFFHANPKWKAKWWEPTGFDRFRSSLTEFAKAFDRPIVVAHGDTHTFRIDKPLRAVPNMTRIEVFGPPQRGAIIVDVVPDAPELFQFTPIFIDG
jgi:hypothetical protein